MKISRITSRTGFELLFAAGIAAIFILPTVVKAQGSRNLEININNGDTVINGKNIKSLTPKEREQALKDIEGLRPLRRQRFMVQPRKHAGGQEGLGEENGIIEKRGNEWVLVDPNEPGSANGELHIRRRFNGPQTRVEIFRDTMGKPFHMKRDTARVFSFRFDNRDGGEGMDDFFSVPEHREMLFNRPGGRGMVMGMGMNRRNSQHFNYESTDANGISTHIGFNVFTPEGPRLKRIAGVDKADLEISDLKLVPDFTTGRTLLMFELPSKAAATVEFTDSEGKVLWEEKTSSGSVSRSFALPLNGIYYLKVKQGGKTGVKQIMKEE